MNHAVYSEGDEKMDAPVNGGIRLTHNLQFVRQKTRKKSSLRYYYFLLMTVYCKILQWERISYELWAFASDV